MKQNNCFANKMTCGANFGANKKAFEIEGF